MNFVRILIGVLLSFAAAFVTVSASRAESADDQLIHAVRVGDLSAVKAALAAGAKVNTPSGPTALLTILTSDGIYGNFTGIIKELLDHGSDINAPGPDGISAFQSVLIGRTPTYLRYSGIMILIMDYKPDLTYIDKNGDGVVALAMDGYGSCDLIEVKNPIGPSSYYPDPLQSARKAIQLGAAVDVPNKDGVTPLMKIADQSRDTDSLSHPAHLEFAKLLLAKGADPSRKDKLGKTAADHASDHKNYDLLQLLNGGQDRGTQSIAIEKRDLEEQLSVAVARQVSIANRSQSPSIDSVDAMALVTEALKKGADPNALSLDKRTTVFGQALGDTDVGRQSKLDGSLIELLLSHGADPNLKLPDGKIPLQIALNQPEIFALLQTKGAKPDESLRLAMSATAAEIDDIRQATFLYQFTHNASGQQQGAKVYFLAITDSDSQPVDPSNEFMKRFAGMQPRVMKNSESKMSKHGIVADKVSSEEGLRFIVGSIKWISKDQVEVEGGYYEGLLSASGDTYHLEKKDGKWEVTKDVMRWIS